MDSAKNKSQLLADHLDQDELDEFLTIQECSKGAEEYHQLMSNSTTFVKGSSSK